MAPRSVAARLNDDTLEFVTALSRVLAVVAALGVVVLPLAWIWTGDRRWGASMLVDMIAEAGTFWLGFIQLGNVEWFNRGVRPDASPRL